MLLIFWLTVKCFIADRTSSRKIKGKNLINIPSGYFNYNSLLVHNWKISEADDKYIKDGNSFYKSLPRIKTCLLFLSSIVLGQKQRPKE